MLEFLAQAISAIGAAIHGFSAHSMEPTYCSQHQQVQYCYYQGAPDTRRVIYYMHGFGDDVRGWTVNVATGNVEEEWENKNTQRPHVVTISKNVWWYTDKAEGKELSDFVQWIESTELDLPVKPERVLYGESMGGHNAFRWASDHPQLFQKLALLCPAFPRYFVDNPPPSEGFAPWVLLAEQLVDAYYEKSNSPSYNPLKPGADFLQPGSLPSAVYLVATPRDNFGFYSGDKALQALLITHPSLKVLYEEQDVDHCKVSAEQLAEFLVN